MSSITGFTTQVGRYGPGGDKVLIYTGNFPASSATADMVIGELHGADEIIVVPTVWTHGAVPIVENFDVRECSISSGKIFLGTQDGTDSATGSSNEVKIYHRVIVV